MQAGRQYFVNAQRGLSLSGLIFVLAVLGVLVVFAMKVVPSYTEYRAISHAIERAKEAGGTTHDMRIVFDKNADINSVTSISGRDLVITNDGGQSEISFSYEKRIPLVGNVSLLIDYSGTTDKGGVVAAKNDTAAQ